MKKKIEKVLFDLLSNVPSSKAVLGHDIAARFSSMVGENINDHLDELNLLIEELESNDFAHAEALPNGNFRVSRGFDFDSWSP